MNTSDLHSEVFNKIGSGLPRQLVKKTVEIVFDTIAEGLQRNGKVHIAGFGTFDLRTRKARAGRNPRTNEIIHLDATTSVGFRASKDIKERIAGLSANHNR